ncbi:hypothetical protein KC216_22210, partial [Mycobacterium tuberculosis]|uniref:hypothetical protein n=1 Tax=Mycobacterium tuberculosis TaxID=1773 RepID=UPI001B8376C3
AASVAAYAQLLQSITLTSSAVGIATVSFTVTDAQGQVSVPASTIDPFATAGPNKMPGRPINTAPGGDPAALDAQATGAV